MCDANSDRVKKDEEGLRAAKRGGGGEDKNIQQLSKTKKNIRKELFVQACRGFKWTSKEYRRERKKRVEAWLKNATIRIEIPRTLNINLMWRNDTPKHDRSGLSPNINLKAVNC